MGVFENFFLLFCTFLGGAIPTMFKFRRPFKDRWNYAVVMSMVTFHLLILTKTDQKIELPLIRLADIAVGFVVASIVNILFLPNFAGNNINNLLAQNFERAGNVVEKCVLEYCKGTVLQHLPEVVTQFADSDLHACFHEIISADSEVEKLVSGPISLRPSSSPLRPSWLVPIGHLAFTCFRKYGLLYTVSLWSLLPLCLQVRSLLTVHCPPRLCSSDPD